MSKKRNNKILLLLLILLIGAFFLIRKFYSSKKERNIPNTLIQVNSEDVYKMEVTLEGKITSILERQGEGEPWLVYDKEEKDSKFQARRQDIDFMLKTIDKLIPEEFTSMDTSKQKKYWSNNETGSRIKLYDDDDDLIADFIVGRTQFRRTGGGNNPITYVRRADDNKVFAVEGFLSNFNKNTKDYMDKSFWKYDSKKITSIEVKTPKEEYTLSKEKGKWNLDGDNNVNDKTVQDYLFHSEYRVVFDAKPAVWQDKYEYEITLKGEENLDFNLKVHYTNDSTYIYKGTYNSNIIKQKDKLFMDLIFKNKEYFYKKNKK